MSITARIPGEPAEVRAVADWLDDLKGKMSDADIELVSLWSDSEQYWTGESGQSWRDSVGNVRKRAMSAPRYMGDAAEVFHAYANRLDRVQDDLKTLLFQAGEVGLHVVGDAVFRPTTSLDYCPGPGAPEKDLEEYEDYLAKVRSYNDLGAKVGKFMGEIGAWVGENIVPLVARVEDLKKLSGTVRALAAHGNEDIARAALDGYDAFLDAKLGEWREAHRAMQEAAETFGKQIRSGNPAVRAAAEAADPRGLRKGAEGLAEQIGSVSRFSRVIPLAGTAINIVSVAKEVADGGSLTSELAELGGALGGGAAGAAGGGAVAAALGSNPVGWAVGGVVVGGLAVGAGARWLWESAVPMDARESIDDFFTRRKPRLEGYEP